MGRLHWQALLHSVGQGPYREYCGKHSYTLCAKTRAVSTLANTPALCVPRPVQWVLWQTFLHSVCQGPCSEFFGKHFCTLCAKTRAASEFFGKHPCTLCAKALAVSSLANTPALCVPRPLQRVLWQTLLHSVCQDPCIEFFGKHSCTLCAKACGKHSYTLCVEAHAESILWQTLLLRSMWLCRPCPLST